MRRHEQVVSGQALRRRRQDRLKSAVIIDCEAENAVTQTSGSSHRRPLDGEACNCREPPLDVKVSNCRA